MNDRGHPAWCTTCQQGPVRSLGALHSWCTNCGALYGDRGVELPTRIGPDPKERRIAWDKYAGESSGATAQDSAKYADKLLAERDHRFSPRPDTCGVAQSAEPRAVNATVAGSSPAPAAKEK